MAFQGQGDAVDGPDVKSLFTHPRCDASSPRCLALKFDASHTPSHAFIFLKNPPQVGDDACRKLTGVVAGELQGCEEGAFFS